MIRFKKPTTDQVIEIVLITLLLTVLGSIIIRRINEKQEVLMMYKDVVFRCQSSVQSSCGMDYFDCQENPTSIIQNFRCTNNVPEKRD